jgi:hypothetical protein
LDVWVRQADQLNKTGGDVYTGRHHPKGGNQANTAKQHNCLERMDSRF